MDALEAIFSRTSVRRYTDQPIDEKTLHTILEAGMSGPSCVNARDWSFLVIQDRDTLNRMAQANGRPAEPLKTAAAAILICGDLGRAFPRAPEYWVVDGAIAAQNMVLAANALGIGSVWLGTWPQMERVQRQAELFALPETIIPHSILSLGYPDESPAPKPCWEDDRVHFEHW